MDVSSGSPIDQINFSQLKAKLNGVIHCIGPSFFFTCTGIPHSRDALDDCQKDLPVLELTSRSGLVNKLDLITNPSKANEIHFAQDNLLPGKYSGNSPTVDWSRRLVSRSSSDFDQIETE